MGGNGSWIKRLLPTLDKFPSRVSAAPVGLGDLSILDNSGNEVGIWYSVILAAAVETDDRGRIVNLFPLGAVTKGNQPK